VGGLAEGEAGFVKSMDRSKI